MLILALVIALAVFWWFKFSQRQEKLFSPHAEEYPSCLQAPPGSFADLFAKGQTRF